MFLGSRWWQMWNQGLHGHRGFLLAWRIDQRKLETGNNDIYFIQGILCFVYSLLRPFYLFSGFFVCLHIFCCLSMHGQVIAWKSMSQMYALCVEQYIGPILYLLTYLLKHFTCTCGFYTTLRKHIELDWIQHVFRSKFLDLIVNYYGRLSSKWDEICSNCIQFAVILHWLISIYVFYVSGQQLIVSALSSFCHF